MATDRVNRVHTPAFLQTFSLGFENREMIADRVAPRVPVNKQSTSTASGARTGSSSTSRAGTRAPSPTRSRCAGPRGRTTPASAQAAHAGPDDRASQRGRWRSRSRDVGTELVTNAMIVSREKRVADLFTTAGNYAAAPEDHEGGRLRVGSGRRGEHGAAAHRHHAARRQGVGERAGADLAAHGGDSGDRLHDGPLEQHGDPRPDQVLADRRGHADLLRPRSA
jgi:hypothetical protein